MVADPHTPIRRDRIARLTGLMGLAVLIAVYWEYVTNALSLGFDFKIFFAAAAVARHGGDPYNLAQLAHAERTLYPTMSAAALAWLNRWPFPQSPLVAGGLMPLLGMEPVDAYHLYVLVLVALIVGALVILAYLYPIQHPARPAALLLLSPVVFVNLILGQTDAVLLLAVTVALWGVRKQRYAWTGAAVVGTLLKPQVGIGVIVLFGVLAWYRGYVTRFLTGVGVGGALSVVLSFLVCGPSSVADWISSLVSFGKGTIYGEFDLTSTSTLYVDWAPHALDTVLQVVIGVAWLAGIIVTVRGVGDKEWWLLTGLVGWMLATPYAHSHDDLVLLPSLWWLVRQPEPSQRALWVRRLLLVAWYTCPLGYFLGLEIIMPHPIRGVGIVPVALLYVLMVRSRRTDVPTLAPETKPCYI